MGQMEALIIFFLIVFGGIFLLVYMENSKTKKGQQQAQIRRACPACGSVRFHAFVEEQVIIPGKVKSQTTLNLNPLKPFTVFNHKEKVVRKGWTRQVSKFVCDDCRHIFQ